MLNIYTQTLLEGAGHQPRPPPASNVFGCVFPLQTSSYKLIFVYALKLYFNQIKTRFKLNIELLFMGIRF